MSPAYQQQAMRKVAELEREKLVWKQKAQEAQKAGKYHNIKDSRGEIKFDSKKEARIYDELMLRLQAGKIRDLKLQPQFTLSESYKTPDGKRIRALRYVADFSYYDCELGKDIVVDVKSKATKTRVYQIKKKLLRERFNIEVTEV